MFKVQSSLPARCPVKINHLTFTLLEATITLYPANADDSPILSAPLFSGVNVENLRVTERWLKAQTRPTGARFPRQHPLVPQYEISLDRPWVLPLAQLPGFAAGYGRYVLDVVWIEEDSRYWHRRVFYGVTINEHALESREIDTGHTDRQVFDAEYCSGGLSGGPPAVQETLGTGGTRSSGGGPTAPPPIESALPYAVRYVSASENVALYDYDPATFAFTESTAGISTGRATLAYTPANQSGTFDVTFAGEDWPALQLRADGELEAMEFMQTVPTLSDLPRLEFYYGGTRVASLSKSGKLFAPLFRQVSVIPSALPAFKLFSASALQAAIRPNVIEAVGFHAFTPSDLSGLKVWTDSGYIAPVYAPAHWPNRTLTGTGSPLIAENDVHYGNAADLVLGASDPQPVLFLDKDTSAYLHTAVAVINPDNHALFAVARPGQADGVGGGTNMAIISSGGSVGNSGEFVLAQFANKLTGRFWTDAGATANTAVGVTTIAAELIADAPWLLCEQEVNGSALIVRLNGALEGQATITGAKAGASKPVFAGSETNGSSFLTFGGFLKAVVVVQGTLSAKEKAKVRVYLNNRYGIY